MILYSIAWLLNTLLWITAFSRTWYSKVDCNQAVILSARWRLTCHHWISSHLIDTRTRLPYCHIRSTKRFWLSFVSVLSSRGPISSCSSKNLFYKFGFYLIGYLPYLVCWLLKWVKFYFNLLSFYLLFGTWFGRLFGSDSTCHLRSYCLEVLLFYISWLPFKSSLVWWHLSLSGYTL